MAQRDDLRPLTSQQAADVLGVSSANTVKNWLEGGYFPGAFKTAGGHWRFPAEEVRAMKRALQDRRRREHEGDTEPPEVDDASQPPAL